jgi:hypothetical protein
MLVIMLFSHVSNKMYAVGTQMMRAMTVTFTINGISTRWSDLRWLKHTSSKAIMLNTTPAVM